METFSSSVEEVGIDIQDVRGVEVRIAGDGQPSPASSPTRLDLTDREQDVLRCLVHGLSYAETAENPGISEGTVRTHVRSVYKKLQVHSVAQAIRKAMEVGLV